MKSHGKGYFGKEEMVDKRIKVYAKCSKKKVRKGKKWSVVLAFLSSFGRNEKFMPKRD